jgi:hypothetical protein
MGIGQSSAPTCSTILSSPSGTSACFSSYCARKCSRACLSATGSPDDSTPSAPGPAIFLSVAKSSLRAAPIIAATASSGFANDSWSSCFAQPAIVSPMSSAPKASGKRPANADFLFMFACS